MPTAVEHDISVNVDPFHGGGTDRLPDINLLITGLHLPDAVHVTADPPSEAGAIHFTLTGDTDTLHLDIQLLVPAVQHTDFFFG